MENHTVIVVITVILALLFARNVIKPPRKKILTNHEYTEGETKVMRVISGAALVLVLGNLIYLLFFA